MTAARLIWVRKDVLTLVLAGTFSILDQVDGLIRIPTLEIQTFALISRPELRVYAYSMTGTLRQAKR